MVKILSIFLIAVAVVGAIMLAGYAVSQNLSVSAHEITLSVPYPIKIAHISDLHYPYSAFSLDAVLDAVSREKPDLVVLSGDVADGRATLEEVLALSPFFTSLSKLCQSYLVIGNHEIGSEHLPVFIKTAKESGITVLSNEIATVKIKSVELAIIGLSDGYLYEEKTFTPSGLEKTTGKRKILLSHRPEKFLSYVNATDVLKPDLIFCGHAHGGGARLGKLSLYAPNQGFFPKYSSGIYEKDGTFMSVSRGLGRKTDLRLYNSYHLPIVTIK